ncbi:MAG: VIT domain-containing protein [Anaerohalosphaeraceae bacterium]
MNRWSSGAVEEWNAFCIEVRRRLTNSGANPDEVIEDIRGHVEAELTRRNLSVVSADEIKQILARIGLPEAAEESIADCPKTQPAESTPSIPRQEKPRFSKFGSFYLIAFGVLLPTFAPVFELLTRICSESMFNPLPTPWHFALFMLIPVSNLTAFIISGKSDARYRTLAGFLCGLAVIISLIYTIWFIPIGIVSLVAVLFMGLGFCGLAPLLSLIASIQACLRIRKISQHYSCRPTIPLLKTGLCLGLLAFAAVVLPCVSTLVGLHMAVSDDKDAQNQGVRLLRTFSDKDYLLKKCYDRRVWRGDDFMEVVPFLRLGMAASQEKVRGVYYRVTGRTFNSVRPEKYWLGRTSFWIDEFDFDQGGDVVGGMLKNLSLVSSQMDATIHPEACTGYLEWIMVFQNDGIMSEKEARCQIQLPPGGVVSRLTLWIDDVECEAAFGGRSQTKSAYKSVVQQRRDPVLVTTQGSDRVQLQCFPILSNGGKMKVRIGITFPLDLIDVGQAAIQLPVFNERNFQVREDASHKVWIESTGKLTTTGGLTAEYVQDKKCYAVRGSLLNSILEQRNTQIRVERDKAITTVWSQKDFDGQTTAIKQQLLEQVESMDQLVLVIDSSVTMQDYMQQIADAIRDIPARCPIHLMIAGDAIVQKEFPARPDGNLSSVSDEIRTITCAGGIDNVPALAAAWDIASASGKSAIVWIHSLQPQIFEGTESLQQAWSRRPSGPKLVELQVRAGMNRVLEELEAVGNIRSVSRTSDIASDVQRLFGQLQGAQPGFAFVRESIDPNQVMPQEVPQVTSHMIRLWAKDQVDKLIRGIGTAKRDNAQTIACRYQLVTPVSGAVVLQNRQQYAQNNLQPVDPETVPVVPEPTTLLLLAGGAILLRSIRHKNKTRTLNQWTR